METVALGLAGIIAPFIAQFVKQKMGWSKLGGLAIAVAVSFVTSFLAAVITGFDFNAGDFTAVFATATVVYHSFVKA